MEKLKEALNKDVKEYNLKLLIISGIVFIALMGFISYKLTNNSYALFTDEVNGAKTITLHYEAPKTVTFDPDGGVIPTGTDWTGSGNSATKQVTKGVKYGELPVPTKEGYTFKGWNGKNLISIEELGNYENWKNNIATEGSYPTNSGNPGFILDLKSNKTYTISMQFKGEETIPPYFYLCRENNNQGYLIAYLTTTSVQNTTYSFQTLDNNTYFLRIGGGTNNQSTLDSNLINKLSNIQLEEGSTATEYEPYYITEDTKVVQTSNHTLKAIWEEEEETQTEP